MRNRASGVGEMGLTRWNANIGWNANIVTYRTMLETVCRECQRTVSICYDADGVRLRLCKGCKRRLAYEAAVAVPEIVRDGVPRYRLSDEAVRTLRLQKFGTRRRG